jgi:multiple sugar transport system substrate-binding protein
VQWYEISTDLPSVQAAWEDEGLSGDERLAEFGAQLETAQAPPSFPTWEEVAAAFDREVEKVTKSGADPAEALETVQTEAESIGTGQ